MIQKTELEPTFRESLHLPARFLPQNQRDLRRSEPITSWGMQMKFSIYVIDLAQSLLMRWLSRLCLISIYAKYTM